MQVFCLCCSLLLKIHDAIRDNYRQRLGLGSFLIPLIGRGMIRWETLIELEIMNSSCSSLSSC